MKKVKDITPQTIAVKAQYAKEVGFESFNTPECFNLSNENTQPTIDIKLNINTETILDDNYEVTLEVLAEASLEDKKIFAIAIAYSGLFEIKNFTDEQKEQILMIHCPTILFPFTQRVVADVVRDGGFQPLMLNPIDFNQLYQNNKQELNEQLQEQKYSTLQ